MQVQANSHAGTKATAEELELFFKCAVNWQPSCKENGCAVGEHRFNQLVKARMKA